MRSRKAQEQEAQLNWIFILIVGALILSFFGFIVIKQKAASESKFEFQVSQQLNTILVGAKVSSGTVQDIETPELDIRFTCNDYYIGTASQRLGNRVVFAPEFLKGSRLITWALDWSVPFKVATFLYMTTPNVRYIVVDDDPKMAVFNALPDKLNKDAETFDNYSADVLKSNNDPGVRFIFVNPGEKDSPDSHHLHESFDPTTVSAINVYTTSGNRKVDFMRVEGNGFSTSGNLIDYTEDEFLYGAIFSDNVESYSCLIERAYARLNAVAKVHKARLARIGDSYKYTNCEGFYKGTKLDVLIAATDVFPPLPSILDTKEGIEEDNTRLQMLSCPLIY